MTDPANDPIARDIARLSGLRPDHVLGKDASLRKTTDAIDKRHNTAKTAAAAKAAEAWDLYYQLHPEVAPYAQGNPKNWDGVISVTEPETVGPPPAFNKTDRTSSRARDDVGHTGNVSKANAALGGYHRSTEVGPRIRYRVTLTNGDVYEVEGHTTKATSSAKLPGTADISSDSALQPIIDALKKVSPVTPFYTRSTSGESISVVTSTFNGTAKKVSSPNDTLFRDEIPIIAEPDGEDTVTVSPGSTTQKWGLQFAVPGLSGVTLQHATTNKHDGGDPTKTISAMGNIGVGPLFKVGGTLEHTSAKDDKGDPKKTIAVTGNASGSIPLIKPLSVQASTQATGEHTQEEWLQILREELSKLLPGLRLPASSEPAVLPDPGSTPQDQQDNGDKPVGDQHQTGNAYEVPDIPIPCNDAMTTKDRQNCEPVHEPRPVCNDTMTTQDRQNCEPVHEPRPVCNDTMTTQDRQNCEPVHEPRPVCNDTMTTQDRQNCEPLPDWAACVMSGKIKTECPMPRIPAPADNDGGCPAPNVGVPEPGPDNTPDECKDGETTKINPPVVNQPDTPVVKQPDVPVVNQPDTPIVKQPDVPVVDQPEVPVVKQPDVPVVNQPDTPVVKQPDVPVVNQPDTPVVKQPDVPVVNQPPVVKQPDVPVVNQPSVPVINQPDTSVIKQPDAPTTQPTPQLPQISLPQISLPQITPPQISLPQVSLPQITPPAPPAAAPDPQPTPQPNLITPINPISQPEPAPKPNPIVQPNPINQPNPISTPISNPATSPTNLNLIP
ncbi:hypothetical protein [Actinoallomurus vinaceus]